MNHDSKIKCPCISLWTVFYYRLLQRTGRYDRKFVNIKVIWSFDFTVIVYFSVMLCYLNTITVCMHSSCSEYFITSFCLWTTCLCTFLSPPLVYELLVSVPFYHLLLSMNYLSLYLFITSSCLWTTCLCTFLSPPLVYELLVSVPFYYLLLSMNYLSLPFCHLLLSMNYLSLYLFITSSCLWTTCLCTFLSPPLVYELLVSVPLYHLLLSMIYLSLYLRPV
jgi:hypothetical protein